MSLKRSPLPTSTTEKRTKSNISAVNSAAVAQLANVCRELLSEGDEIVSILSQIVFPIHAVYRRPRLDTAKLAFEKALRCATQIGHNRHKAEAERGLFRVEWERLDELSDPDQSQVILFYCEAMRHASLAICHGVHAQMDSNWIWSIKVDSLR